MLLNPTGMDIELMEMLQKCAKRCTLCHLGKGIDILGETLATITELTVWTWNISMCIVDIADES